jgi:hypothetical protein
VVVHVQQVWCNTAMVIICDVIKQRALQWEIPITAVKKLKSHHDESLLSPSGPIRIRYWGQISDRSVQEIIEMRWQRKSSRKKIKKSH